MFIEINMKLEKLNLSGNLINNEKGLLNIIYNYFM